MMYKTIIMVLSGVALLSGCIKVFPDKPQTSTQRVDLMAFQPEAVAMPHNNASIKVFIPTAPDTLNSLRVAITQYQHDLKLMDYLADIEWKDNLLSVIQQRLMEALRTINIFSAISLDTEKLRADYAIYSYIHKFEIEQKESQTVASIGITFTLNKTKNNEIIEQKTVHKQYNVDVNTIAGYMVALNKTFMAVQAEFIDIILQSAILKDDHDQRSDPQIILRPADESLPDTNKHKKDQK